MQTQGERRNHGGGWNKGKAVGKKRPFTPEQIGQIRYALKAREDRFGLALFETALSTLLRSVDLLSLTVGDVVSQGAVVTEFSIMQRKTGKAHKVELSDPARAAIKNLLELDDAPALLPPGRSIWLAKGRRLNRLRYSNLVKDWARLAHLDPKTYSTHSLRRTMAAHVFRQTNNVEVVRNLLGQKSVTATSEYLEVSLDDALAVKRRFEI